MINLTDELRRVTSALETAGVSYALVGGLAVAAHGHARATKDIDLAVTAEECLRAVEALVAIGYRSHSGNVKLAKGKLELRRLNRFDEQDFMVVDLLVLVDPSLALVISERERGAGDNAYWVASRAGLTAMKLLRGSPQDLADIAALAEGDEP